MGVLKRQKKFEDAKEGRKKVKTEAKVSEKKEKKGKMKEEAPRVPSPVRPDPE